MSDIASALGLAIDTTPVANLRDRLRETRQAGADAAQGLRDAGGASQQMSGQIQQLVNEQARMNAALGGAHESMRSGTVYVQSYADSLLKLATAGAAVYGAYRGMNEGVRLLNDGMREQASVVGRVHDALASFAAYGLNAFQLMSDKAIAARRAIAEIGEAAGSTGAQFEGFAQRMAPLGASSQNVQSSFGTLNYNLTHHTPQAVIAQRTLASYGVSATGSPDDVAARFLGALRNVQAGPERTQAAENVFGPGGADLIRDTVAGVAQLTDKQRELNQLQQQNAQAERVAAERRRQADEASIKWYEDHSIAAVVASVFGSPTAKVASDRAGNIGGQSYMMALHQMFGSAPGGFMTGLRNLGQTALYGLSFGAVPEPSYPSSTALDYHPKPPLNPQDYTKGFGDLSAAGLGTNQRVRDLHNLLGQLSDDMTKGAISAGDYRAAIASVNEQITKATDPLVSTLTTLSQAGSLYGFAPGQARSAEQSRRSFATAYFTAHPSQARDASGNIVGPSQYPTLHAPGEDAVMSAYIKANVLGPIADAVREAQSHARVAAAGASAATGGDYEAQIAELRAGAAEQKRLNPAASSQIDKQLSAQIAAADSAYTKAANSFIYNTQQMATAAMTVANVSMQAASGVVSPAGLFASAHARARQMLPQLFSDDANTKFDAGNGVVQADVMQRFTNFLPEMTSIERRIRTMIDLEQRNQATLGGGSAGATYQMRSQIGLTQVSRELDSFKQAFDSMLKLPGVTDDMAAAMKRAVDTIDSASGTLKKTFDDLERTRQQTANMRIARSFADQYNPLVAQIGILRAGGSLDDVTREAYSQRLLDQSKAAGGTLSASTANQMADMYVEAKNNFDDLIKANKEWTKVVQGTSDTIASAAGNLLYSGGGKRALELGKSVGMDISKLGVNYFVDNPIKSYLNNYFGADGSGSNPSFGKTTGAGFDSWMGQMFGVKTNAGNPYGMIGSWLGIGGSSGGGAASGSLGGPAGATPVYVVNSSGAGVFDAAANSGGLDLSSIAMGSGGGGPGDFSLSDLANIGSSAAGGGSGSSWLSNLLPLVVSMFHDGGVVGGPSQTVAVNPGVFRGARRFHSGLMPDEFPAILQQGERVIPRGQSAASVTHNHINMNISTPDANSFRKTQGQIMGDMHRKMATQGKRNS